MSAGQPLAQLARRLVWCGAVKGHQRGGNPGHANDVGAPAILGDRSHLNQVGSARDRFLKTMYGCGHNSCWRDVAGSCADFTHCGARHKRSARRKPTHRSRSRSFATHLTRNIFSRRFIHRKCTVHQQVLHSARRRRWILTLDRSTLRLKLHAQSNVAGSFAAGSAVRCCVPAAAAADDVTLLRVFLKDGTVLVSYGEPARVDDRVVFSMPTAATPNPPLHLVNLAVRARRLGAHEPLRGGRACGPLPRHAGASRLRGAFGPDDAGLEPAERRPRMPAGGWRSRKTHEECWRPGRRPTTTTA